MATDKNFLRANLTDGIYKSLDMNLRNAPILGLDQIKIFEIGKVFPKEGEHTSLCIAIGNTKNFKGQKPNELIKVARETLLCELDVKVMTLCTLDDTGGLLLLKDRATGKSNQIGVINNTEGVLELNLDVLIKALPEVTCGLSDTSIFRVSDNPQVSIKYEPISPYPFVLRDIAVFVPGEKGKENEVETILKKEGTDLLVRADLFDTFTKKFPDGESKTSYAYRLVFLSHKKTLTDEEINAIMEKITAVMNEKEGWMVR